MSSSYPAALDNVAANKTNATREDLDHPTHHNKLADGLNAVQNTLGVNPQAPYATVASRLAGLSTIPNALVYKGTWNPSTNTPTLADGTGTAGHAYIAIAAASIDLGSGSVAFAVGDYAVYNGSRWQNAGSSSGLGLSLTPTTTLRNTMHPASGVRPLTIVGATDQADHLVQLEGFNQGSYASARHIQCLNDGGEEVVGIGGPDGGIFVGHKYDWSANTAQAKDVMLVEGRSTGDCVATAQWGGIPAAGPPDGGGPGGVACFNAVIPYWNYPGYESDGGQGVNDRTGAKGLLIHSWAPNDDVTSVAIIHQGNGAMFDLLNQQTGRPQGTGQAIKLDDFSDKPSLSIVKYTEQANASLGVIDLIVPGTDLALNIRNSSGERRASIDASGAGVFYGALTIGQLTGANNIVIGNGWNSRPEIYMTLAGVQSILYIDTSGGKHRLMCQFPTGAAQQVAIEP